MEKDKPTEVRVAVFTDNEELYSSLTRAFRAVYGVKIVIFRDLARKAETPVIYDNLTADEGTFEKWVCGFFRRKLRNPLVVIGATDEESFIRTHPILSVYCYNHAYVSVPCGLEQLHAALTKLKPVDDEDTRRFIINDYCRDYEYALVTHDLKIVGGDRDLTILNFERVRDFYQGKRDRKTVEYLKMMLSRMRKEPVWMSTAQEAQKELIEKVAEGRKANG